MSLGNTECNPQTFLENNSRLDKLLIIIQNEDIAAHVHKVVSNCQHDSPAIPQTQRLSPQK